MEKPTLKCAFVRGYGECDGAVAVYTQTARSFGVEFTSYPVLCMKHAERLGAAVTQQQRDRDPRIGRQLSGGERRLER